MFEFDSIPNRNINLINNYNFLKCWEVMNCPEDTRINCWAYRLNLSKECWIIRKKINEKFKWHNPNGCNHCKFYIYKNNG